MVALNGPAHLFRLFGHFAGGLAVVALLTVGLVTSAQAQQVTVQCSAGGTVSALRYFKFDADAGTCAESNNSLGNPANGIHVLINPGNNAVNISKNRYENGVNIPFPAGAFWSITNYTGVRFDLPVDVQVDDVIPTTGVSSAFSITTTVNGSPVVFTINGVTKTDGVDSLSYGLVTVTFVPSGSSPADKPNIANHLLSSFNKVGGGVFGAGGIPMGIANGTGSGAGFAFTPNGVGNAGSGLTFGAQADAINPMDRDFGFFSQGRGYAALGQGSPGMGSQGDKGVNFSFNLQNMVANGRKSDGQVLGAGGGLKDGPYVPRSRWNAWAFGRYTEFDDDSTNADRDGHLWTLTSGLSYALGERTTIGAFTRLRDGEVDSKAFDSSLDSDFFGGGVFLATTLQNGVRVMGAGLVEGGDNDIVISGDSGSFDSDLFSLEARIDKRFTRGRHWIEPTVKILYSDLERDSYTDSSGAAVASGDITLGRLTFGPTIGTTIHRGNATFKPFARINGVWEFENEDDFTLGNGTVVHSPDTAIKLGGGLEIAFENGVVLNAAADWFSFDDDFEGVTATGGIGVPLSALGMGHAGSVSFNLASDGDDASAKARIRIPLGGK